MPLNETAYELFKGFSKLTKQERFHRLLQLGALSEEDSVYLQQGGLQTTDLAEQLVENVIGYFQLPLGIATNFCIDGQAYVIPMAVEETSIIAALSKTAKWIREHGEITTSVEGTCILGQIQLAKVRDYARFEALMLDNKAQLIASANQDVVANMVKRGGGVVDLVLRQLKRPDGGTMAIIHVLMNPCDAMGANSINQVLEYLKQPIEQLSTETVTMCILSNLNDTRLTTARVVMREVEPELGRRLHEASLFAELDPYRAATHNKGVMNGIDPVLIATGNDWRAVEAGIHAYASREGSYRAISTWRYADGVLTGTLTAPIIVGTVGGVTGVHPSAKLCLNMLNVNSANQLSRVIAAVGLVQNLGAIRALCSEGIIQGHMKLHIDNILLQIGATNAEIPPMKQQLQQMLLINKRVSLTDAAKLLADIRTMPSS